MLPLAGVRIVAVEQYGAGPFGTLYLADLGAEIIKIENPATGGDVSRRTGAYTLGEADSHFFQTFNRNKRSLTLDLKSADGREVFERLIGTADAVLNNLRGDQPAKLGIDYAALSKVNPRVVCVHLSAYGRDNDRAAWPGYDFLMQAEAGYMSLTGEPDTPPARFGLSIVDYMAGLVAALGLLAALLQARQAGSGRDVDVSLFDVALHQLSYPATWFLNEGAITNRLPRSAHPSTVPCQLYKTADGWVFVMCMLEKFWRALIDVLRRPELGADPRFTDFAARRAHRDELTPVLDEAFSVQTTDEWLQKLRGVIPIAPVYDLEQALNNPHVREAALIQTTPHAERADLQLLANPIKVDGERLPAKAGPALGEDSDALLQELGYSREQIAAMRSANIL